MTSWLSFLTAFWRGAIWHSRPLPRLLCDLQKFQTAAFAWVAGSGTTRNVSCRQGHGGVVKLVGNTLPLTSLPATSNNILQLQTLSIPCSLKLNLHFSSASFFRRVHAQALGSGRHLGGERDLTIRKPWRRRSMVGKQRRHKKKIQKDKKISGNALGDFKQIDVG